MYIISSAAFLYFNFRVIGQNVLVLPYNPNFILWTLASLCLSSELVYIYLASRPIFYLCCGFTLYICFRWDKTWYN